MDFAVIFDMDGVLVVNHIAHLKAWVEFCHRKNIPTTEEELLSLFGRTNSGFFQVLYNKPLTNKEITELAYEKEMIYREIYKDDICAPAGLISLLELLKKHGIKIGMGTSAPIENVDFVLEHLQIGKYFDTIVHEGQVSNGKPHPEIYLKAAEMLNVDPATCIVFEDSVMGIQAGISAGMKVVAITSTFGKVKLQEATKIIDTFENIDLNFFESLL